MRAAAAAAVFLAVLVGLALWIPLEERRTFLAGAGAFAVALVPALIIVGGATRRGGVR